jgi:light-regulated signal transduction histidine kinase (bacteriophytochrome)
MNKMIEGVLSYSKVSSVNETFVDVNLNTVVDDIKNDLEVLIQQKSALIQTTHLPTIQGIPILIHQLFYNLINNSLKFSKDKVKPIIKLDCQSFDQNGKSFYRITLEDNGIGFDQKHAETIFQAFSRLHTKEKFEGTGLGLSLCRKIAERHGGSIKAEGRNAEGALFKLILPAPQAVRPT